MAAVDAGLFYFYFAHLTSSLFYYDGSSGVEFRGWLGRRRWARLALFPRRRCVVSEVC